MKPTLKNLYPIIAFVIILIIGISLRITVLETRDYWYDEAFTGIVMQQDGAEMHRILLNDVHPPMYYWMLKPWTMITGATPIGLRLFSVFFGILTIITAFASLKLWFPKKWMPAILGTLVFAINPFLANYSQEARMYTLLGFLILLASNLLWRSLNSEHNGWRIAYSVVAAFILLTHYLGFIFMLAFFLYDLWQRYKNHPNLKKWKDYLPWFASSYGIPLIAGLAWLPFFIKQAQFHPSLGWVPNAALHAIPESIHKFLFGSPIGLQSVPPALGYRVEWLSVANVSLFIALLITGLVIWLTAKKKWTPLLSFLGFMTAFPLILTWLLQAVAVQLYVERFLSGSAIFLMLFLIAAIYRLGKDHWLMFATGVYIMLVILIQPWSYQTVLPRINESTLQYIDSGRVVFTDPFDYTLARFYVTESKRDNIDLLNLNTDHPDLAKWILIDPKDEIEEVPNQKHLVITDKPDQFRGYELIDQVGKFTILESHGN